MKVQTHFIFRNGQHKPNYIDCCPEWLRAMFEDSYSPFRAVLDTLEPDKVLRVTVNMETLPDDPHTFVVTP